MSLEEQIKIALSFNSCESNYDPHLTYRRLDAHQYKKKEAFEIEWGDMYERPELSFASLKRLSEIFGTEEIDVDQYSNGGCESCDYGSDYGHTIQIYNPTKNVGEFYALVSKGTS